MFYAVSTDVIVICETSHVGRLTSS